MAGNETATPPIELVCFRCDRTMLAHRAWEDDDVVCPYCDSPVHMPLLPDATTATLRAVPPSVKSQRFFYFHCPHCDTLIEGHSGISRRVAPCPACAARIRVPVLNQGDKPGRSEIIEAGEETPAAHAYGASGIEAPRVVTGNDGTTWIVCPRCSQDNDVAADACEHCGAPFSTEGISSGSRFRVSAGSITALVLAGLGALLFTFVLPPLLAVVVAIVDLSRKPVGTALILDVLALAAGGVAAFAGVMYHVLR